MTFNSNIEITGVNKDQPGEGREIEKEIPHTIVEITEYVGNGVVSKTIVKKSSGNVTGCFQTLMLFVVNKDYLTQCRRIGNSSLYSVC